MPHRSVSRVSVICAAVISVVPAATLICARHSSQMSAVRFGAGAVGVAEGVPVTIAAVTLRAVRLHRSTTASMRPATPSATLQVSVCAAVLLYR